MSTERRTSKFYSTSGGRKGWRLRFYSQDEPRKTIWLGDITSVQAEQWRKHVGHITACRESGEPICRETTKWLSELPLRQRAKLERGQLVQLSEASRARNRNRDNSPPDTLGPFLDWYIANQTAKPRTIVKWKHGRDCLLRFFKANRKLDSITHADALAWRTWLAKFGNVKTGKERTDKEGNKTKGITELADATVRRRTGQARQFFNFAIDAKLLESNPFDKLPATVYGNDERKFFVSHDVATRILEHAPGAEWEAIISLARYGGLRAPSEVMELKWEHIDFANSRLCIFSPKLAHNRSKGIRYCPIFHELLPYLERLAELAAHRGALPTDYIITKPRGSESVLRKPFLAILKRAGIPTYPKPFQNLRASRETELMEKYPIKDVCSWLGNSPKVAMEHYAMTRQESFDRAAGLVHENCGPAGGPGDGSQGQNLTTFTIGPPEPVSGFDQGKQWPNPLMAALGSLGQLPLNRPGRT